MKNTYQELELIDGTKVKLTLNFARLLRIKNRDPKFYDDLMRILQYKDFDVIFDTIRVLYAGYLCAKGENDEVLTEEQFMELVPFNHENNDRLAGKIIRGGKKVSPRFLRCLQRSLTKKRIDNLS